MLLNRSHLLHLYIFVSYGQSVFAIMVRSSLRMYNPHRIGVLSMVCMWAFILGLDLARGLCAPNYLCATYWG
jgi:hypothetical protein